MSASHAPSVPRGALWAAAALIGVVLTLAAGARLTGMEPLGAPKTTSSVVAMRALVFEDDAQGRVLVRDGDTHAMIAALAAGEGGFIRGVMRGLARERRMHAVSAEAPFRLTQFADGRLWLEDPATQTRIDLGAFGPENISEFAVLLREDAP